MSETLSLMFLTARRILVVPATSFDVQCCFLYLKWVRDERQQDMKEETHVAACLHLKAPCCTLMGRWSELTSTSFVLLCVVLHEAGTHGIRAAKFGQNQLPLRPKRVPRFRAKSGDWGTTFLGVPNFALFPHWASRPIILFRPFLPFPAHSPQFSLELGTFWACYRAL